MRDRTARRDEERLVIDGPRALSTFVAAGGTIEAVFVDDDARLSEIGVGTGTDVFVVERGALDRISDAATPQGVLAIGASRLVALDDADAPSWVILDGVQDPGNVGAVVRVAAAAGVKLVVAATGTADPTSPRAVRASAGTVAMVDLVVGDDAVDAVRMAQAAGLRVAATAMDGSSTLAEVAAMDRVAWVFGAEGRGVHPDVLAAVDYTVSLPMTAPVESLNVAVTAGVALYGSVLTSPR